MLEEIIDYLEKEKDDANKSSRNCYDIFRMEKDPEVYKKAQELNEKKKKLRGYVEYLKSLKTV